MPSFHNKPITFNYSKISVMHSNIVCSTVLSHPTCWRKNRDDNKCEGEEVVQREVVAVHCSRINKWMLNYSQLSWWYSWLMVLVIGSHFIYTTPGSEENTNYERILKHEYEVSSENYSLHSIKIMLSAKSELRKCPELQSSALAGVTTT